MKKLLICICVFAAMLAAVSLSACKKNAVSIADSGGFTEISAEIPFVGDFACEYYGGDGFNSPVERSATFDSEDELLIKISFTLFTDAYNAGKRKLTLKLVLSEGFIGNIVGANTSAVDNADLTVAYDADDKISKNCSIEIKVKFNYCSGNLKIGYAYDYDEFQTTGAYNLSCDKTLIFTYDKTTDGYIVNKDSHKYLYYENWLRNLSEFTIPKEYNGKSVTGIGYEMFSGCSSLNTVNIPDTIRSKGNKAFYNCNSLAYGKYDAAYYLGNEKNPFVALMKVENDSVTSVEIKDTTKIIYAEAFKGCKKLNQVTIPDGIVSIGYSAFEDCSVLTRINIPAEIKIIGEKAFSNCDLTSLTIPQGVKSIGKYAFSGCRYLTRVTVLSGSMSVEEGAFSRCEKLTRVDITDVAAWCGINFKSGYSNPTEYAKGIYLNGTLLTDLVIPEGVNAIGNYAFSGCVSLASVTIPKSVTEIGEEAFDSCSGLTRVNATSVAAWCNIEFGSNNSNPLKYANKLYLNGNLITNLNITNGVERIGNYAFVNLNDLLSVTIPNSVKSIGENAFADCGGLTSVVIPNGVKSIGDRAFLFCRGLNNVTIPDTVENIGMGVFGGCDNLKYSEYGNACYLGNEKNPFLALVKNENYYITNVNINAKTKIICGGAFIGCALLKDITIPDGAISIGDYAFGDCSGLTSITISNSVSSIGEGAFENCNGLTSVTIPDSVTDIGNAAFSNCSGLKSVTIPSGITNIRESAFEYCSNLQSIVIPSGVTSIGSNAFIGCKGLTSVIIPSSVTDIGKAAFTGCVSLTSINIPNSVISVGSGAFWGCIGLQDLRIPKSVTYLGTQAFSECTNVRSVTFEGTKAEWMKISSGVGRVDNGGKTVKCTDGEMYFYFY